MSRPSIKIYGERNSGTRYLQTLIALNLDAQLLRGDVPTRIRRLNPRSEKVRDLYFRFTFHRNLGWKHQVAHPPNVLQRMPVFTDRLYFITITKNPFAWLLSMYRRPYHCRGSVGTLDQFLENPWPTVGRENGDRVFANPIVMWNRKNWSYLGLRQGVPVANLRYEDLLADPEREITQIAAQFSIKQKLPRFANLEPSTKARTGKSFSYYQEYYLGEQWKKKLGPSQLDTVIRHLDPNLLAEFNYECLEAK